MGAAVTHWRQAVAQATDDPLVLMRLTKAQTEIGDLRAARRNLWKLENEDWHERFKDLPAKIKELKKNYSSL